MARITVEDCLSKMPNRFLLVNMVSKRVRQIREGSEYLVNSPKNEDIVVALREVAAGKISIRKKEIKAIPEEADSTENEETNAEEPIEQIEEEQDQ